MGDLTITFLGTGTSQGVPVVGCDCGVCRSSDSRDNRTRSSVYVESPECAWVIDTGPDFRNQCLREGIRRLDAVVYTHSHTDHIMGFDDLRVFCPESRELPIYASAATMADLQRVFEFAFNGRNRFPGYVLPMPHVVSGPFLLGATELVPLPVKHGRAEVFGYLFRRNGEKLAAYLSDCKEVPDEIVEIMRGARVLIVDALRRRPHPTHFCFDEALDLAREAAVGETWFTHLCHEVLHADVEKELPPNVRIGYDGLKLEV
jgi:phosphoribosyl 1,2-cyclic phosphate phosphodiesterase